jgi:hypothetical protein
VGTQTVRVWGQNFAVISDCGNRVSNPCCHHDHQVRTLCTEHLVDLQTGDTRCRQVTTQEWNIHVKMLVVMFETSRREVSVDRMILLGSLLYSKKTLSHTYFVHHKSHVK